jgi:hypothetical protein
MHVLQHIAVVSESPEQAYYDVKSKFDEMYSESEGLGGWSDWYVVGGGRWNSNPANQYEDSWNDVVAFSNAPDKFRSIVQNALETRSEEMGRIRERLELDRFISLVDTFIESKGSMSDEDRFDMVPYYVSSAAKMLNGYWNQDSYFFDLANFTTTPKYMLDSLDKGIENWYLVPVDFHF